MAERELHDVTDRADITVAVFVKEDEFPHALSMMVNTSANIDEPSEHLVRAGQNIASSVKAVVEDHLQDAYSSIATELGVNVEAIEVDMPISMAEAIGLALTSARLAFAEERKGDAVEHDDLASLAGSIARNTKRHAATVGQISFRLTVALSAMLGVMASGDWTEDINDNSLGPTWDGNEDQKHRLDVEDVLRSPSQEIDYEFARELVRNVVERWNDDRLGKLLVSSFLQHEGSIDVLEDIGKTSFERLLKMILAKSSRAGDKMMDVKIPEGTVDIAAAEVFLAMTPQQAGIPSWSTVRTFFVLQGATAIGSLDDYLTRSYLPYAMMETIGGVIDPENDNRGNLGANIASRALSRIGLLDEFDPTKMAYGVGGPLKMDSKVVLGDLDSDK